MLQVKEEVKYSEIPYTLHDILENIDLIIDDRLLDISNYEIVDDWNTSDYNINIWSKLYETPKKNFVLVYVEYQPYSASGVKNNIRITVSDNFKELYDWMVKEYICISDSLRLKYMNSW